MGLPGSGGVQGVGSVGGAQAGPNVIQQPVQARQEVPTGEGRAALDAPAVAADGVQLQGLGTAGTSGVGGSPGQGHPPLSRETLGGEGAPLRSWKRRGWGGLGVVLGLGGPRFGVSPIRGPVLGVPRGCPRPAAPRAGPVCWRTRAGWPQPGAADSGDGVTPQGPPGPITAPGLMSSVSPSPPCPHDPPTNPPCPMSPCPPMAAPIPRPSPVPWVSPCPQAGPGVTSSRSRARSSLAQSRRRWRSLLSTTQTSPSVLSK